MNSPAISSPLQPVEWFSSAELADLALPGLPATKRAINMRARDERWAARIGADGEVLVRRRAGRGGGAEYHVSLLPGEARIELERRGIIRPEAEPVQSAREAAWAWFDEQNTKVRDEADRRLRIVTGIVTLIEAGSSKSAAVAEVADSHGVGSSTLWSWLKLIDGVDRADWLPTLAPRRKGGGVAAEIDPELWTIFKSDYLRASAPTLTSVYERIAAIADERGVSLPCERSFRRRLDREVPAEVLRLKREGEEALRRSIPAQRRSVEELHALEWVNIDGHKFDVFVKTPEGRVIRPIMLAIQDIYSRKILAWRIGGEESAIQTRLVFADLFRNFGVPKHCLLDNGRAFASKWITGGAKSRFRFKVRQEEPTGLLTGLGIQIHWALPYRGQSKPIERAFRDLADYLAKHPECEGAYTGNSPMAKPENYGSKAVDWDRFCALVDGQIARHNARSGRRTETAKGRSFDEAFAASYAVSPIGKATPEQLRRALLAADNVTVNRQTSEIALHGNRYWHPELDGFRGDKVTVRFDPDNLHSEIHVYDLEGRYLVAAQIIATRGFADAAGAKETAKRVAEHRRRAKALAEAEDLISAEALAELQAGSKPADAPEPTVVRAVRTAAAPPENEPEKGRKSADVLPIDRMRRGFAKIAANNS